MTTDPARLAAQIDAVLEVPAGAPGPVPNYNVAPTAAITTVVSRHTDPGDVPTRRVRLMRWGLVPPWVKAGPDGNPETRGPLLINARAEKVTTSPAFRSSATHKRCLVPMDGFYEWRAAPERAVAGKTGGKTAKTPFYVHRSDGGLLFMAGLWSVWRPPAAGEPLLSCTVITTDAVGELAGIHDRMPLIVAEQDWDRWLDPDAPAVEELLTGRPDIRDVAVRPVSTLVNNVRNNGPELLDAVRPDPQQPTLL